MDAWTGQPTHARLAASLSSVAAGLLRPGSCSAQAVRVPGFEFDIVTNVGALHAAYLAASWSKLRLGRADAEAAHRILGVLGGACAVAA